MTSVTLFVTFNCVLTSERNTVYIRLICVFVTSEIGVSTESSATLAAADSFITSTTCFSTCYVTTGGAGVAISSTIISWLLVLLLFFVLLFICIKPTECLFLLQL